MSKGVARVGVREFREELAHYLSASTPVAITSHGRTVGYYIPARGKVDDQAMQAMSRAAEEMEGLLAEHGITENEVVREFRARRLHS